MEGWEQRSYVRLSDALDAYEEFAAIYRFVNLVDEQTITTTEVIRDSTQEQA